MTLAPADRITSLPSSQVRAGEGQSPRPSRPLMPLLLVLPAAGMLLTPFGLLAAAAMARPDILMVLADKPLVALKLVLGLMVSMLFCLLPFGLYMARSADRQAKRQSEEPANAPAPLPSGEATMHQLAA